MSEGISQGGPKADWYPDPAGRHEYRYWDGNAWTEHVSDSGQVTQEAIGDTPNEEYYSEIREAITAALGAWAESQVPAMKAQNPVENTDNLVDRTVIELSTAFGAILIMLSRNSADFGVAQGWAASAVGTLFETVTEDKLTEQVVNGVVGDRDNYIRNLARSPEVVAMAGKYGQSAEAVARGLANDFVEQSTQAVRTIAPIVLRVAGEQRSRSALETQLASAVATARNRRGA